jgi:hypothetical protein
MKVKLKNVHGVNVQDEDRYCRDGEVVEAHDARGDAMIQAGYADRVDNKKPAKKR